MTAGPVLIVLPARKTSHVHNFRATNRNGYGEAILKPLSHSFAKVWLLRQSRICLERIKGYFLDRIRACQDKEFREVRCTSSTARGGGGSFKGRKGIEEIGCCESRMTKQKHAKTLTNCPTV